MSRTLPAVIALGLLVATALVMPAVAHPGVHGDLSWGGLIQHLGTAWHIWPIVAVAAAGLAVLGIGQRRQVAAKASAPNRKARS